MYYIGNKYIFHRECHFAKITKNSPRTKQTSTANEIIRNLVLLTWLQNNPDIYVFRIRFGLVLFTCKQNKLTNKNKSKVES